VFLARVSDLSVGPYLVRRNPTLSGAPFGTIQGSWERLLPSIPAPYPLVLIVTTAWARIHARSERRNVLDFGSRFVCDTSRWAGQPELCDFAGRIRPYGICRFGVPL